MLNKGKYDQNSEYFMLSVTDNKDVRWIRNSFMTRDELNKWFLEFITSSDRYKKLEVFSEDNLDFNVSLKNDDGNYQDFTLRELFFGKNYEEYAKLLRGEIKE